MLQGLNELCHGGVPTQARAHAKAAVDEHAEGAEGCGGLASKLVIHGGGKPRDGRRLHFLSCCFCAIFADKDFVCCARAGGDGGEGGRRGRRRGDGVAQLRGRGLRWLGRRRRLKGRRGGGRGGGRYSAGVREEEGGGQQRQEEEEEGEEAEERMTS